MELTKREKQVVQLMAKDMGVRKIAEEMKVAIKTVQTHVYNLKKRNSIKTEAGIVIMAYKNKIIE